MKLYIYEHCPFCARARMIFGLKKIPVDLSVIMEGDADTPIRLIGRKVVPILEKDDGSVMSESMDIVRYVDALVSQPVLTDPPREEFEAWFPVARQVMLSLVIPRFTRSSFREISTDESRRAYREREEAAFGDLDSLMERTPEFLGQMVVLLDRLELAMEDRTSFSTSDLVLYSTLRSLSIVKGLAFPRNVRQFMRRMEQASGLRLFADRAI